MAAWTCAGCERFILAVILVYGYGLLLLRDDAPPKHVIDS